MTELHESPEWRDHVIKNRSYGKELTTLMKPGERPMPETEDLKSATNDVMAMLDLCGEVGGKKEDETYAAYLRRIIDDGIEARAVLPYRLGGASMAEALVPLCDARIERALVTIGAAPESALNNQDRLVVGYAADLCRHVRAFLAEAAGGERKGLAKVETATLTVARENTPTGPRVVVVSAAFKDQPNCKVLLTHREALVVEGTDGVPRIAVRKMDW